MRPQADNLPTTHPTRVAAEVVLLGLIALAPWFFGCVPPAWKLALALGVFVLLVLWAAHAIIYRQFSYSSDPISVCLLGLVLLTAVQLVPLPESIVRVLSPTAADWHRTLIPESPELLPGESDTAVPQRAGLLRLSVAPAATEDLLVQFLAVFLVYAVARNFVANGKSFRRLAWVGFATGVGLAVIGLAQHLSGEKTRLYWRIETGIPVFGPFSNKNHFAFQMNLFAGLAGGLFLSVARRPGGWRSPPGLALLGGLGLMAVALAFSQSRGGVIAALAAAAMAGLLVWSARRRSSTRTGGAILVLVAGIAIVGGALTAWFGGRGAADRFATLWGSEADNRSADWYSVWPLVEQFPLVGVGGGGLARAEPMVRTRSNLSYEFNTLDNEYLEALVEGGIARCALTLALALIAVWSAGTYYRRNPDHPGAPLLLGSAFGLGAVAFQSAGDFGLHTSSVALTAAVLAAFVGAARQPGVRSRESGDGRREAVRLGRGAAYAAAAVLLFAGLLVVVASWRDQRVEQLRDASAVALRSSSPGRLVQAIRVLEAAAKLRPADPTLWDALVTAHLYAAAELQQSALAAVTGPAGIAIPMAMPPTGDPDGHITAALKAARTGRDCQPLRVAAHLTLGIFADRFARSEPAASHFDRAKRVAGFDANTWYITGLAAANRDNWPAAAADWHESLARSLSKLEPITRRAATHLAAEEIRARLLPDDPAVWLAATPFVFSLANDPDRAVWMQAVANRWASGPEPTTVASYAGWGTALEDLDDSPGALHVWRRAVERFPDESGLRDRLALRLEAEEMFEEAVPALEWLTERYPERGDYRLRLEAARHALKLKAEIDRP